MRLLYIPRVKQPAVKKIIRRQRVDGLPAGMQSTLIKRLVSIAPRSLSQTARPVTYFFLPIPLFTCFSSANSPWTKIP